jgi:hypothetical protein
MVPAITATLSRTPDPSDAENEQRGLVLDAFQVPLGESSVCRTNPIL